MQGEKKNVSRRKRKKEKKNRGRIEDARLRICQPAFPCGVVGIPEWQVAGGQPLGGEVMERKKVVVMITKLEDFESRSVLRRTA